MALTLKDLEKSRMMAGMEGSSGTGMGKIQEKVGELTSEVGTALNVTSKRGDTEVERLIAGQNKIIVETKKTNGLLETLLEVSTSYYENSKELIDRLMISQELAAEKPAASSFMGEDFTKDSKSSKAEQQSTFGEGVGATAALVAALLALAPEIHSIPNYIKSSIEATGILVGRLASKIETGFSALMDDVLTKVGIKKPAAVEPPVLEEPTKGPTTVEEPAKAPKVEEPTKGPTTVEEPAKAPKVKEGYSYNEKTGRYHETTSGKNLMVKEAEAVEPTIASSVEAKVTAPEAPAPSPMAEAAAGEKIAAREGGAVAAGGAKAAVESEASLMRKASSFIAKSVGKQAAKLIPLAGAGLAVYQGFYDALEGDTWGAISNALIAGGSILEATGLGTAPAAVATTGLIIENLAHETYKEVYSKRDDKGNIIEVADYAKDMAVDPVGTGKRFAAILKMASEAVMDQIASLAGGGEGEDMGEPVYDAMGNFTGTYEPRVKSATPRADRDHTGEGAMNYSGDGESSSVSVAPEEQADNSNRKIVAPRQKNSPRIDRDQTEGSTVIYQDNRSNNTTNQNAGGGGSSGVQGSSTKQPNPSDFELYGNPWGYAFGS